jgi:hypothetical protein
MMFRRFKFELFEADVADVEMAHDFFIPVTFSSPLPKIKVSECGPDIASIPGR